MLGPEFPEIVYRGLSLIGRGGGAILLAPYVFYVLCSFHVICIVFRYIFECKLDYVDPAIFIL